MNSIHHSVPFYSNTPDNFHCFQAALRMILSHYVPERNYTWEELDSVTGRTSDYTWPLVGLSYCRSLGLSVDVVESFDYARFVAEGYEYLLQRFGKEYADTQKKNSDLEQEKVNARGFVASVRIEVRIPSQEDLSRALLSGRLAMCNVNARILQDRDGYAGHFVVLTGVQDSGLWLHDPGLPAMEDRFCSWSMFECAWSYPNIEARNVMIISRE
jgi:hypothetical protein